MNAIQHSAELLGESLKRFNEREPIQPHLSPAERAQFEAELAEDQEAVNTIVLCARHQKRIADDVLHISKLNGNLITLAKSAFDPAAAVENTLKMFNLEAMAKQIKISFERHASLTHLKAAAINADQGRFVQSQLLLSAF